MMERYDKPQFSSVQSLSHVQLFANPWTAARQASLSFTISRSLLRLMSIESVMSSNHLIFCHPLVLLPSISPSIRVLHFTKYQVCVKKSYGVRVWGFNGEGAPETSVSQRYGSSLPAVTRRVPGVSEYLPGGTL